MYFTLLSLILNVYISIVENVGRTERHFKKEEKKKRTPHTHQDDYYIKKPQKTASVGEDVETLEPGAPCVGMQNDAATREDGMEVPPKN